MKKNLLLIACYVFVSGCAPPPREQNISFLKKSKAVKSGQWENMKKGICSVSLKTKRKKNLTDAKYSAIRTVYLETGEMLIGNYPNVHDSEVIAVARSAWEKGGFRVVDSLNKADIKVGVFVYAKDSWESYEDFKVSLVVSEIDHQLLKRQRRLKNDLLKRYTEITIWSGETELSNLTSFRGAKLETRKMIDLLVSTFPNQVSKQIEEFAYIGDRFTR